MAIEITSESVVKILVRRGTDSERQLTTLTEGELGYCVDTQRLFIGDGITKGGIVAGNKFLGFVSDPAGYSSISQPGDFVYRIAGATTGNTLYSYSPGVTLGDPWVDIHPKPFIGANGIQALEKASTGRWRVTRAFVGDNGTPPIEPSSGFTLKYDDSPGTQPFNSLARIYNRLDFDSRYISLCSFGPNYANTSFYLGNVKNRTVTNNLSATLNVDNSLFINSLDSPSYQIQIYGNDPLRIGGSKIESTRGFFDIKSKDTYSVYVNGKEGYRLSNSGSTMNTIFSSYPNSGSAGSPNFDFKGVSVFRDDIFVAADADVTILGNLSVYGDATYLETTVTTTSALSVINKNPNVTALLVGQYNTTAPDHQAIAKFVEGFTYGGQERPVLHTKERQYIAFNAPTDYNFAFGLPGYNIVGYGDTIFTAHPYVGAGNFGANFTNSINLTANNNFNVYSNALKFTGNTTYDNNLTVDGTTVLNDPVKIYDNLEVRTTGFVNITGSTVINFKSDNAFTIDSSTIDISPAGNTDIAGTLRVASSQTASSTTNAAFEVVGGIGIGDNLLVANDITAFSSDKRLKDIKGNITNALEKVCKLSGIEYTHNEVAKKYGFNSEEELVGVIAQEVQEVLPQVVKAAPFDRDSDGKSKSGENYLTVQYEKIVPLLIEAIKELKAKIDG
jgi:hypothetical protein